MRPDSAGMITTRQEGRTGLWLNMTGASRIASEIQRLKKVFGPRWIVSPSHEALLPDVPPANVGAMAEAARRD